MLGGKDSSGSTTSVFQCSLSVLLLRASPDSQESGTNVDPRASIDIGSPWKSVCPIPLSFTSSSLVPNTSSGNKNLVVFGGYDSDRKQRSSDIHVYDPTRDSWLQIGAMISPRSSCISSVLSNDRVIVIGGKNRLGLLSDTVEIGLF